MLRLFFFYGFMAGWAFGFAGPTTAEEMPLTYERINLSASASQQVENDTLVALLYAQREGPNAAKLADEVNQTVRWSVERARQTPQVKVQTLDYRTHPVYQKERLTGWRVRQSIRLESMDAKKLSGLLGQLQERLAVQSIDYTLSPSKLKEVENQLIEEAIKTFQQRADLIATRLKQPEYRLVRMDVQTAGVHRPMPMGVRTMAEAAAEPPMLEAGTQTVQVDISGTIELQLD